jgi:hypothetical protein
MDPWFDGMETVPAKFSPFVKRYVHFVTGKESHHVIVSSHVKPKISYKFLVHILLSWVVFPQVRMLFMIDL